MRTRLPFILLALSVPLLLVLNLAIGSVSIPMEEVCRILMGETGGLPDSDVFQHIVLQTRLPQALTAIACGAGLSVAGLLMQTIFRNPLAGPSVLGISSAASLGVAFLVLFSGSIGGGLALRFGLVGNAALTLAAILGALLVMALIVFLAGRVRGRATLLIMGVMIGYIATAIIGVLKYFSNEEEIRAFVIWGLGSFSRVTGGQVTLFCCMIGCVLPLTLLLIKPLNIFLLGDLYATNLGLNLPRVRMQTILAAGVLTAIVTAYCGPIMFLGLAVPHICRGLFGTSDHRILLPTTIVAGASLALVCNLISRWPGIEGALPVNSVTALIGAPVALIVLLKRHTQ